jgi:hypothetical protein
LIIFVIGSLFLVSNGQERKKGSRTSPFSVASPFIRGGNNEKKAEVEYKSYAEPEAELRISEESKSKSRNEVENDIGENDLMGIGEAGLIKNTSVTAERSKSIILDLRAIILNDSNPSFIHSFID